MRILFFLFQRRSVLAFVAAGLFLAGCGGGTSIKSDLGIKGAPDWVNEGTKAVSDAKGRLLQGVGQAGPLGNTALQRSTAENRARAELARILNVYMDASIRDYTASTGDTATVDIRQTINSTAQAALSGSRILGYWRDKETGDLYAFAELDLKRMEDELKTGERVSQAFKDYFAENAEENFEKLAEGQ